MKNLAILYCMFFGLVSSSFSDEVVSLSSLIVLPSEFNAKKIQVSGYLNMGRIYLTKDHALIKDVASSLLIDDSLLWEKCSQTYISVNATFYFEGQEPPILSKIRSAKALPSFVDCIKKS